MKILASFLCLLAGAAYAEPQTGSATAKDACSVANTGNNNIFTITCGIGKQQGDALLKIMNKILANHLDPDAVMAKLNEILHAVNPNAPKITYTFDGSERLESPGRSINILGEAGEAFRQMEGMEQRKEWPALVKLSMAEINAHPEWLTPYVFAGEAQLMLGHKPEAIELLGTAEKRIAGNPDYDGIQPLLRSLLAAARR